MHLSHVFVKAVLVWQRDPCVTGAETESQYLNMFEPVPKTEPTEKNKHIMRATNLCSIFQHEKAEENKQFAWRV